MSGPGGKDNPLYQGEVCGIQGLKNSLAAAMLAGKDALEIGEAVDKGDAVAGPLPVPFIRMRGVRTHTLQNVSVSIPEHSFTVVSGPSGSGKSSLVLETLYKACQRRYAEQLSPFLRDRLALAGEGDYESIEPLKPAVALAARYLETTPRSTVGTISGINDILRVLFSRLGTCEPQAGIEVLHASHFSFNHQDGACPSCNGLGHVREAELSRWLINPGKGILDGAFSDDKACRFFLDPEGRFMAILQCAAAERAIDIQRSWQDLSREARQLILDGSSENFDVTWKFKRGKRSGEHRFTSPWIGLNRLVLQDYQRRKEHRRQGARYAEVVFKKACPSCRGLRLRGFVLQCRIGMITLAEVLAAPLTRLRRLVENNGAAFFSGPASAKEQLLCREIMPIMVRQLDSLINLGIGYLAPSRAVETLSSGEHQRLRLASLLGNRLNHTLFVLDEISRGLHPFDVSNLLAILHTLLQGGNTIVAIDHHPLVAAQADWFIRMGPGSGRQGGQVLAMGSKKPSWTIALDLPPASGIKAGSRPIVIASAAAHNLKRLDLNIPSRGLTVLCGVSGSGKSTLLHRVIHESAVAGHPVHCAKVSGLDQFKQVCAFVPMNPQRCGGERLSDFLGVNTAIHDAFVRAAEGTADRPRLKKALTVRSAASSCRHCEGKGVWTTDLDYMGSFVETCSHCRGSGLSAQLCRLDLLGESLADTLAAELDTLAAEIIAACRLEKVVSFLQEFALGYLNLGRRLHSLSAGELQRLRLARLFLNLREAPSLLLLDEPDSGLGFEECRRLIDTMKQTLRQGHAAIVISHHPLMMSRADYLVDLGPGAGEAGGELTACGTPRQLLAGNWPRSKTAAYLQQLADIKSE